MRAKEREQERTGGEKRAIETERRADGGKRAKGREGRADGGWKKIEKMTGTEKVPNFLEDDFVLFVNQDLKRWYFDSTTT